MIITGKSKEIAIKNQELLREFLIERGLELNENKTLITHIKTGFDFLGFNIRRMKWNARLNSKTDQETVLIIKPSIKGIKKLKTTSDWSMSCHLFLKKEAKTKNWHKTAYMWGLSTMKTVWSALPSVCYADWWSFWHATVL